MDTKVEKTTHNAKEKVMEEEAHLCKNILNKEQQMSYKDKIEEDEEVINKLEERVNNISSVTEMLEKGMTPEDILKEVMGDMDVEFTDKIETGFVCNCGKEKIAKALAGISKKDMDEIINDGKEIEVKCDFCNTTYKFSVEELQTLRKQFR